MELRRNSSRTGRLAPASAVVWLGGPCTVHTVHCTLTFYGPRGRGQEELTRITDCEEGTF